MTQGTPQHHTRNKSTISQGGDTDIYDVLIVGAGFTGIVLALLCGKEGLRTALIDRKHPGRVPNTDDDGRVSALSAATRDILKRVGLWSRIADHAHPIRDIRVDTGGARPGLLYRGRDVGTQPMGHMVENVHLRWGWAKALAAAPHVDVIAPATPIAIDAGDTGAVITGEQGSRLLQGRVVVGADGRNSATRALGGIGVRTYDYNQTALVFTVTHEHPHNGLAEERFLPSGPLALLPMAEGDSPRRGPSQSGVVWTLPTDRAQTLHGLEGTAFDRALAEEMPAGQRGALTSVGKRWLYPLSLCVARRRTGRRLALIGDAAQAIHPLAGQGLNLGLRDAADLADILVTHTHLGLDIGAPCVLDRYARRRRWDALGLIAATHGLNWLFSHQNRLGGLGLQAAGSLGMLKRWLQVRAMGYRPSRLAPVDLLAGHHRRGME